MGKLGTITRRTFLISAVAITGGVVFGYWKYKQPHGNPLLKDIDEGAGALTPYVLIDQNGISIVAPRAEMGQGIHTTLAAMVAEELDVTLEQVNVLHGPASKAYFNAVFMEDGLPFASLDESGLAEGARSFTEIPAKLIGMQLTGGSTSTYDHYDKMRTAGAAARESLLQAAANKTGIDVGSLSTSNGKVITPEGKELTYNELASAAAEIEPSAEPALKPRSEWKLLGKSQDRVDIIPKSTGTAEFGVDIDLPNMLYATVKVNPNLLNPMNSFDASKAESMRGVKKIIEIENGIAVVATNSWYAFQAIKAIECDWVPANYPVSTDGLRQLVVDSFEGWSNSKNRNDGDVDDALENGEVISGEYEVPFLAHATMEPMNATAWLHDGQLDIWAGNQIPTQVVIDAKKITGLSEENINVKTPLMGGGFGRRAEIDFVKQAVQIAKEMEGVPVKMTWTREEDTTHDYYRPLAMARFEAVMGETAPTAIDLKLAASGVFGAQFGRWGYPLAGPDNSIVQAAWDQPYGVENYRVTGYKAETVFPVMFWRSVGASQNAFFHESMIDELAHAKGLDPLQMRLDMMTDEPSKKVLEKVRDMSNWNQSLPEGHARGVGFCLSFGVPTAQVIEIAEQSGKIKIVNAYIVADVGIALDPRNIEAQLTGGMLFGLTAAIMGEITITDGKVDQTNFHNYNSIRMNQSPNFEVGILENGSKIKGVGEPGTPPAAPALSNAIFALTGKRIRKLPLNKEVDFA